MKRIPAVGLTGGIGSGKSTVAGMFAELGVPVLDLDRVGRAMSEPGGPAVDALVRAFGTDIVNTEGWVDRRRLADKAFASDAATQVLNAILHPLIWQQCDAWLAGQRGAYALIEASVLLESGGEKRMDAVVVVTADMGLRRQRVQSRGYPDAAMFDAIIARQCDDARRLEAADHLIDNSGGLEQLRRRVEAVHRLLLNTFQG